MVYGEDANLLPSREAVDDPIGPQDDFPKIRPLEFGNPAPRALWVQRIALTKEAAS